MSHSAATLTDIDPDDPAQCDRMIEYIRSVTASPLVREALEVSSRSLARTVARIDQGQSVSHAKLRRTLYAVTKYVLRMSTRPTPFGLMAGVGIAGFGDTARVSLGQAHRKGVRADAEWLLALVGRWERRPDVLPRLHVVLNDLGLVRGDRLVLPYVRQDDKGDHAHETSVRHAAAVRRVCEIAGTARPYPAVVRQLGEDFPEASREVIESMLNELIGHEFLLTDLRPPSFCADPVRHVLDRLGDPAADPEFAALAEIDRALAAYERRPPGAGMPELRTVMTAMDRLHVVDRPVQVDMRVDAHVTLPAAVAEELEHVSGLLQRMTVNTGLPHLSEYHGEFVEMYGIDNPVPLKDLLDPDRGLGPPAGYIRPAGTRPAAPYAEMPPGRVQLLAALAQRASRDGLREVRLTAGQVEQLTPGRDVDPRPPNMELPVTVLADSVEALDAGDFRMVIPPSAGSSEFGAFFGRFLHLFGDSAPPLPALRELHSAGSGALAAQLTFLPHRARLANVGQVPRILDRLVSVGAYVPHDDPDVLGTDDIAVYADRSRLHVFSLSLGRELRPMPFHLMNLYMGAPNAVRLLAEIGQTGRSVWRGWQWGAMNDLPFLPRVVYGRTVLASARWLAPPSLRDPAASWERWQESFEAWREQWSVPDHIEATRGDQRIRLDLTSPLHRRILMRELRHEPDTVLYETPGGGEPGTGWLSDHANEMVVPLLGRADEPASESPVIPAPAPRPRHHPGGQWLYAKLYVSKERHEEILVANVTPLLDAVRHWVDRWFFIRYSDPDPHLRLRFHASPEALTRHVLPLLHDWAAELCHLGMARRLVLDTYEPEVSRYGGEKALEIAEQLFCADSEAAIAQLRLRQADTGIPPGVLAAANYVDVLHGLGDERWRRWLLENYPKGAYHSAFQRHRELALKLIDPEGGWAALSAMGHAGQIPAIWERRSAAVARYGEMLRGLSGTAGPHDPAWTVAVNGVLHMHHNRLVGIDREAESASYAVARGVVQANHDRREFGT
jgi:thiopeptide-type bacteriocin biosynthesis protein